MNDYEAHLGSYDHSHRQRLKDMKNMVKDPNAGARARKAEAKETGLVSIKLPGQEGNSAAGGANKKGGFKKSSFKSAFAPVEGQRDPIRAMKPIAETEQKPSLLKSSTEESDTEDEGYELYNPRFPTD